MPVMHFSRFLPALAAFALASAQPALAQKRLIAKGWTRTSAGLNLASFVPTNPGFGAARSYWRGANYRFYFVEMGTMRARANYPEAQGLSYNDVRINHTYLGGYLPIGQLGIGRRQLGIRGMLVYPYLAGGVATTQFVGNYGGLNGGPPPGKSVFSYYVAPGLSLQLPYCTLDARLQATHYGTLDYYEAPVKGWQVQPTVCLQFDLLSDIFKPERVGAGAVSGYVSNSTYSTSGNTVTRTVRYSYTSVNMTTVDVGPFSALVPRFTWSGNDTWRGPTRLGGLGWSRRDGTFTFDTWADVGQRGVASSFETLATEDEPVPKSRTLDKTDDQFAGTRLGGRVMARAGVDLYSALLTVIKFIPYGGDGGVQDANGRTIVPDGLPKGGSGSSLDLSNKTGFFRLVLGLGAGGAYAGPITFLHPEQEANLDRKFGPNNPNNLVLNRYTDPRQGRAALALQAYASIEAGCATFSIERTSYTFDELGKETTLSVAWLLPMRRLRAARIELDKPVTD